MKDHTGNPQDSEGWGQFLHTGVFLLTLGYWAYLNGPAAPDPGPVGLFLHRASAWLEPTLIVALLFASAYGWCIDLTDLRDRLEEVSHAARRCSTPDEPLAEFRTITDEVDEQIGGLLGY